MPNLLTISDLTIRFSPDEKIHPVLNRFHLALKQGECVGLVGESGSGKTLTALSILQLLPIAARVSKESTIYFRNQNLLDLTEKQMRHVRGKHIGMIFQDAMTALNPVLTIKQQMIETIRLHLRLSEKASYDRATELLESVGVHDVIRCLQSYPHELSGGMRQRAMIAIAICAEPDLIIADEPTTALDVTIQAQVLALLNKLKKEKQCALLFVGHDLSVVSTIADEMIVLKKGETIEKAKTHDLFRSPKQPYTKELFDAILPITPQKKSPENGNALLQVENLKQYFPIRSGVLRRIKNEVKAVDDVSFSVLQGETVAIVGESGSGKTTVAKAILQLIKNTDGRVVFQGKSLSDLSRRLLRGMRNDMQMIFQDPHAALNPRMTVGDSIGEGLFIQNKIKNKKAAIPHINAALKQVDLPIEFQHRYPHELSGGQRQRVCIARALILSPKLLILDEPTSALDVSTQKQILLLLDRLQTEKNLSYLLITHNLSVVAFLAHKVVVMYHGKIVEQGSAESILLSPKHLYTKKLLTSTPTIPVIEG